jgi:hypothetical protein
VRAVEGESVADGDEDVVHAVALAEVVVGVVGGGHLDAHALGELREGVDAGGVPEDIVVLELDVETVAEGGDVPGRWPQPRSRPHPLPLSRLRGRSYFPSPRQWRGSG